jgi:hypothetical protein
MQLVASMSQSSPMLEVLRCAHYRVERDTSSLCKQTWVWSDDGGVAGCNLKLGDAQIYSMNDMYADVMFPSTPGDDVMAVDETATATALESR